MIDVGRPRTAVTTRLGHDAGAGGIVGDLGHQAAIAHLLVALPDVLDPGVGLLDVPGFDGDRERVARLEVKVSALNDRSVVIGTESSPTSSARRGGDGSRFVPIVRGSTTSHSSSREPDDRATIKAGSRRTSSLHEPDPARRRPPPAAGGSTSTHRWASLWP